MKQQARILFLLFFCLLLGAPVFAQKKKENYHENQNPFGRKKKEKKNQSKALSKRGGGGLFKKKHSAGNADAFAGNSITGRKGFLSKIFGGGKSGSKNASLRKTRPGKVQDRENTRLFKRSRTSTKKQNGSFLNRQKKQRSKSRSRGNSSFHSKKH